VFSNNASSLLAASIAPSDTIIQVASGAAFPSPTGGDYFVIAFVDALGGLELAQCTARTGDLLTVVRGQEGTTAQSWTLNVTRVELRLTAATVGRFLQKAGDTLEGDIDADGNEIQGVRLTDTPVIVGGLVVGASIRGAEGDGSNEILVPSNGTRATAGGQRIVVESDPVMTRFPTGALMMWYGSLLSIPDGWALCDGTNGTPDLRGRFVRGAGGSVSLDDTGGWSGSSVSVDSEGTHTHSTTVTPHALTEAEMPSHRHRLFATQNGNVAAMGEATSQGVAAIKGATVSGWYDVSGTGNQLVQNSGLGDPHSHGASTAGSGAHQHSVPTATIVPPYTGIYFIMKVNS
jgi:microcystin-dependent protein